MITQITPTITFLWARSSDWESAALARLEAPGSNITGLVSIIISAAPFCRETGVKGKYLNDFPCISNPTSTN